MKIKVYGTNGKSRVVFVNSFADIYKISNTYLRWEYL